MDNPGLHLESIDKDAETRHFKGVSDELTQPSPEDRLYERLGDDGVLLHPLTLFTLGENEDEDKLIPNYKSSDKRRITIERTIFTQTRFNELFKPGPRPQQTLYQRTRRKVTKYVCSGSQKCCRVFLFNLFPFLTILKDYNIKQDIPGDIVAGFTVGIMHIPQGMAYGILTTLPPVYGLYMSFFPVLVYFFFGSSKHISVGTFSVACLMVGTSVSKALQQFGHIAHSTNNTNIDTNEMETGSKYALSEELNFKLSFAVSLACMVGIIQLAMGIFRLGFITVYLSDPLISGFTTAAAVHVVTSQIKNIFGVTTDQYSGTFKLIWTYHEFFRNLGSQINYTALITSCICLAVMYSVTRFINHNRKFRRKMFMPVPIELILVVLGTVMSHILQFETKFNVDVIGDVPTGLPNPSLPFQYMGDVIFDAIPLAVVVFAVSISMAKILAKKHNYEIDANQELIAFGVCNIVSSFFASPSASASMSRSVTQERAGGKTQVAGFMSCALLLIVMVAIGPYFRTLPNCVLAAIIVEKMRGMFLQVRDVKTLWIASTTDCLVWIVSFFATVILDVELGLGVAIVFALLTSVYRSQRPYICLLGRIPGTDIYKDIKVYEEAREIPGVKIFRCESSLFYINAEHFRTCLYKMTVNPMKIRIAEREHDKRLSRSETEQTLVAMPDGGLEFEIRYPFEQHNTGTGSNTNSMARHMPPINCDFHTIIFECSSWSFIDTVGMSTLMSLLSEYQDVGIRVMLANCKDGIRETFEKTSIFEVIDRHDVYIALHDAVHRATCPEDTGTETISIATDTTSLTQEGEDTNRTGNGFAHIIW